MSLCFILLSIAAGFLLYFWHIISEKYRYWDRKNVPHLKPTFPFGTLKKFILLQEYRGVAYHEHILRFPDSPYVGGYLGLDPVLIVKDPDYLRTILVKDFAYFSGRFNTQYNDSEKLYRFLFFAGDDDWKVLRQNTSPMYSSGKMKNMFNLIKECTHALEKMLQREVEVARGGNVKNVMARFTMDCITSCAFGINSNLLGSNSESSPFRTLGKAVFNSSSISSYKGVLRFTWPGIFKALKVKLYENWMFEYFEQMLKTVFEKRQYKPSDRNDFVDMVLSLRDQTYLVGESLSHGRTGERKIAKMKIDNDLLVAQCLGIFAAGFETSSTTMALACYEIAKNQRIQELVIREVDKYFEKHDGILGYEVITELPYLEACIEESLRMHPIAGIINREVLHDYTFNDGLQLKKGDRVVIPVHYLHHSPQYHPEPEVYRPERFIGEEKKKIKPFTYLAFGEGPRMCLGIRFSKMQVMAGLATMFKKYKLELLDNTPTKLTYVPKGILLVTKEDIYLKFVPRSY